MTRSARILAFVRTLWHWYATHKRRLPWRDLRGSIDQRAYGVLVSEFMLQQTQVSRVMHMFTRFLKRFPSIQDLAQATTKDVLIAWKGMGYNSRALRLRSAARIIVEEFHGRFPRSVEDLQSISGIGHYTAAAIMNFAFNVPTPCIDTNIRRILHRTFFGPENPDGTWRKSDRELLHLAEEVWKCAVRPHHRSQGGGKKHDARNWVAALMDFGSLIQTKRQPRFDLCPLTKSHIMVTTPRSFERSLCASSLHKTQKTHSSQSREPGREINGTFVPRRIMRGQLVDILRTAPRSLSLQEIIDRVPRKIASQQEREWCQEVLEKLIHDGVVKRKGVKYGL